MNSKTREIIGSIINEDQWDEEYDPDLDITDKSVSLDKYELIH